MTLEQGLCTEAAALDQFYCLNGRSQNGLFSSKVVNGDLRRGGNSDVLPADKRSSSHFSQKWLHANGEPTPNYNFGKEARQGLPKFYVSFKVMLCCAGRPTFPR